MYNETGDFMWKIGNIEIKNNIVLAPMAGISNPAYMKICEEMGVGYAVTELISSEAIVRNNKKTLDMLNGIDKLNIPVAVQLFGSNPDVLARAAQILTEKYNVKIIDLNMGCPVPKVALRAESGSALLKNPDKIYEIVKTVKEKVNVPVTAKIRIGWDKTSINAVEVAKKIEEAGADAIAVHARTRSEGYSGKADWSMIKKVKESVKIPVIGNGDVKNCFDAKRMIDETGCDAVMIGRGTLGNPWLIKECADYLQTEKLSKEISNLDKIDMILKHFKYLLEEKPEKLALLEMRTNAAYYLKNMPNGKEIKGQVFKTTSKEEFINLFEEYKKTVEK